MLPLELWYDCRHWSRSLLRMRIQWICSVTRLSWATTRKAVSAMHSGCVRHCLSTRLRKTLNTCTTLRRCMRCQSRLTGSRGQQVGGKFWLFVKLFKRKLLPTFTTYINEENYILRFFVLRPKEMTLNNSTLTND